MRRLKFFVLFAGTTAILFAVWLFVVGRIDTGEHEIARFSDVGSTPIERSPYNFTVNGLWEIHVKGSDSFGAVIHRSDGEVQGIVGLFHDHPGSYHSLRPGTYQFRISTRGAWSARVVEVDNPADRYYGQEEARRKKQEEEEQRRLKERIVAQRSTTNDFTPLPPYTERTLKPRDTFKECSNCPEMVVLPTGTFIMGSDRSERGRGGDEGPQHMVAIAQQFAVGKFAVTFNEWDTCVLDGGCNDYVPPDRDWGRGQRPVINVSWDDAQAYVAWISRLTGKTYRLLTEAEFEYAARAKTMSAYFWGDEIGKNNANCDACDTQWDNKQTAPVGSFAPNKFGLYDMSGNVWQWVEDCYHDHYDGAPADGSAWIVGGKCRFRLIRGGSYFVHPDWIRSAQRFVYLTDVRPRDVGFRVARNVSP